MKTKKKLKGKSQSASLKLNKKKSGEVFCRQVQRAQLNDNFIANIYEDETGISSIPTSPKPFIASSEVSEVALIEIFLRALAEASSLALMRLRKSPK